MLKTRRVSRLRTPAAAPQRRFVPESSALAADLAELSGRQPGWDEPMRVRGALRRLRQDASDEGWRQAVAIFGEATARAALARLRAEAADLASSGSPAARQADANVPSAMPPEGAARPAEALLERVVAVDRFAKIVKGGRKVSFAVVTVVGDGDGGIGLGKAKAKDAPVAVEKALISARRNMVKVQLRNGTIEHDVHGAHGATKVTIFPGKAGQGIVGGGPMRAVFDVMGVTDVVAESIGARNPYNMIRATLDALGSTPMVTVPGPDRPSMRRVSNKP